MAEVTTPTHPAPLLLVLALRWLALGWLAVVALLSGQVQHPVPAAGALVATAGWTVWTTFAAARRTVVLVLDLAVAVALVVLSGYVHPAQSLLTPHPWFAGAYPMAAVAAWGVARQTSGGLLAGAVVGLALPWCYTANGVPPTELTYLQAFDLAARMLGYVLLGGCVGAACGQLDRLRAYAGRTGQRAAELAEHARLVGHIHDNTLRHLGRLRQRGRELVDTGSVTPTQLSALLEALGRQESALRGLAPPVTGPEAALAPVDLAEALALVADGQPELPVSFTSSGPVPVAAATAAEVTAAVGELLTNVVRHARAGRAWLTLLAETDLGVVTVTVRDDGAGFPARPTDDGDRLGLRLCVVDRVRRLGGRVRIGNRRTGGAQVELVLPATLLVAEGSRSG